MRAFGQENLGDHFLLKQATNLAPLLKIGKINVTSETTCKNTYELRVTGVPPSFLWTTS